MTFSDIVTRTISSKIWEPIPRIKDKDHVPRGRRNRTVWPRHIAHTYPIIGGISGMAIMAESITANNALLDRFKRTK